MGTWTPRAPPVEDDAYQRWRVFGCPKQTFDLMAQAVAGCTGFTGFRVLGFGFWVWGSKRVTETFLRRALVEPKACLERRFKLGKQLKLQYRP